MMQVGPSTVEHCAPRSMAPPLPPPNLLHQVVDIEPEVDLDGVALALVEVAEVQGFVLGDDGLHLGRARRAVAAGEAGGRQLGLLLGEVDERRQGLGQAHEEQVVDARLHHPLEQGEAVLGVG